MSGHLRDFCLFLKERAELVHKVHLLCLLARGRIVDDACNDPLIQVNKLNTAVLAVASKLSFSYCNLRYKFLFLKFNAQAALLSLLPSYLTKVSNLEKVIVKDIAPLLRWVWIYWPVVLFCFVLMES